MSPTAAKISASFPLMRRLVHPYKFLFQVRYALQSIPDKIDVLNKVLALAYESREQAMSITQVSIDDATTRAEKCALDITTKLHSVKFLLADENPELTQDIDSTLSIIIKLASNKETQPYDYQSKLDTCLEHIILNCQRSKSNLFLEHERLAVLSAFPLISALRQYNHF